MTITNPEALNERANNLGTFNGIKLVLVSLFPDPNPTEAHLEVHFYNNNEIANILADTADPKSIFPITGGTRLPAGPSAGQVKVTEISGSPSDKFLTLKVSPIGDYSTYMLSINYQNIDPVFSEINFKFRPGCFNIDCKPEWEKSRKPPSDPSIDYLAKDYDSFRHTFISAMMERVPGWEATSEADLDQVLIDLFSAAGDELSDYQDRVANEAYIGTARKRVSIARHARLMDYHIHQGNQASTWLIVKTGNGLEFDINSGFLAWTGDDFKSPKAIIFMSKQKQYVHFLLNKIGLYTWSDSIPALSAGSTTADLKLTVNTKLAADTVRNLIRNGTIKHLIIQEWLNPLTGKIPGRNSNKRQLLSLLPGDDGAETMNDPLTGQWFVRINWNNKDKLKFNYCFTADCPEGKVENISLFHGNLLEVYHGKPVSSVFKEFGSELVASGEYYFDRTAKWGTICRLDESPLIYKNTPLGGEIPTKSTLSLQIKMPDGSFDPWDEVINLVHSDDSEENGDHFIVETDENGKCLIRFGNGINGKKLPEGAEVQCTYQIGRGIEGNIGRDKLNNFDKAVYPSIESCHNPFDVTNGRDPEPVEEIIRKAPEAYRAKQLRAVTLNDYIKRTEELNEVSRASAKYMWTGSWRTVRISVDPAGTTILDDNLRKAIARHLDSVRLIGEDLEIRSPVFIPLDIKVTVCIDSNYWTEDIKFILEQEFSDGYTPDGRMGFFHPDLWTFGQKLYASQIEGRVKSVVGVDYVKSISMKRYNAVTPGSDAVLDIAPNEIIIVKNNPDSMEDGFIFFNVKGGRV